MRRVTLIAVATLIAASCTGDAPRAQRTSTPPGPTGTTSASPTASAPTTDPANLRDVRFSLRRMGKVDRPLALAVAPGDPETLYVNERGGRVRALRDGRAVARPVLDLSDEVSTLGERGLLALSFSPDGGKMYVYFTDTNGTLRLREYAFANGRADESSSREILSIKHPEANHNGGQLFTRPDGTLWLSIGDGGGAGDPEDDAQSLKNLYGKLIRIDPRPDGKRPYRIPDDNPYVGREGARGEIVAIGLRNPWRWSFDRDTGDVWLGDVGQYTLEEIDYVPADEILGANFAWNRLEGTRRFKGRPPRDRVDPIHVYNHNDKSCAVVGGYVYRGAAIPGMRGVYVYTDFCRGMIRGLAHRDGEKLDDRVIHPKRVDNPSSMGEDANGELYVLSHDDGGVYRLEPA